MLVSRVAMNKKQIYHLLSLILSLHVKADRIDTVITNLPKEKSDWENGYGWVATTLYSNPFMLPLGIIGCCHIYQ